MISKNCGYITNNTKKVQKGKNQKVVAQKEQKEEEKMKGTFFSLLIKPATMRQEKQKLQFFASSSSIVGQS